MNSFLRRIIYGGGVLFDLFKWLIAVGVIVSVINIFWVTVFVVDGVSMDPTFKDKELVLLDKKYYKDNDPIRGDVVVVRYPGDPDNKKYVKRVVGLPGEKIEIIDGKVRINGQLLIERYLDYDVITSPNGSWKLNQDEYFLMGDNRPMSNDCRFFGPVEKRFFYGKAKSIIFPRIYSDF